MGNWIAPTDDEPTELTFTYAELPCETFLTLFGAVLAGGGQYAMITHAKGEGGVITVVVQPFRVVDDPAIPTRREIWREVYTVIDLDRPFLNAPRIT